MNSIEAIAKTRAVQSIVRDIDSNVSTLLEQIIEIQQIPAPTFNEAKRAAYIEKRFEQVGLVDVGQDKIHNVYGRFPSPNPTLPPVIISAHSDTVFPANTDLTVKRDGRYVYGPGIGDNSTGVGGIIFLAELLHKFSVRLPADVWFVSNVGEEGLGDLNGMRAVVKRFDAQATYLVVEGGLYGQISHQAIGVRRYRIQVQAPGGHSWGSFGNASAIHILGHLISKLDQMKVPTHPKTTYNVGVIEGGTSINSIAQTAHMLLDLRSEDTNALLQLVQTVEELVEQLRRVYSENGRYRSSITIEQIGNRPAGQIDRNAPLVKMAEAALTHVGCRQIYYISSSSDANIPLSQGLNGICIGLAESNFAHRLDEYLDPKNLPRGMAQLLYLTLATAGFKS
ncbi:MAG: M20/M25/M40 family metallo-hydrolase [Chloroflexi bacterium]|nr:MAG: M20/M25/M40 family metallo-hydrolase [Chloroflexota bacterium]